MICSGIIPTNSEPVTRIYEQPPVRKPVQRPDAAVLLWPVMLKESCAMPYFRYQPRLSPLSNLGKTERSSLIFYYFSGERVSSRLTPPFTDIKGASLTLGGGGIKVDVVGYKQISCTKSYGTVSVLFH